MIATPLVNPRPKAIGHRRFAARGTKIKEFFFDGSTGDFDAPGVTNCTVAADTDHWMAAGRLDGLNVLRSRGLRITPTASTFCNVIQSISPTIDLSTASAVMRFRLHPDDTAPDVSPNSNHIAQIDIRLRSGGTLTSKTVWLENQKASKEWIEVGFDVQKLFAGLTITAVDQLYITLVYQSGYVGYVTMDWLLFYQRPAKARVMVRLDDGYAKDYRAAAIADSLGIPIHVMVARDFVGINGYMTLAQIQRVRDMPARHCVLNHGAAIEGVGIASQSAAPGWRWSDAGQTTLTSIVAKRSDILRCADYLDANGLGEFSRVFVVPGGSDQRHDVELYRDGTVEMLWYYGAGSPTSAHVAETGSVWPPPEQLWRLGTADTLDGSTAVQATAIVDSIVADKRFGMLVGHNLNDDVLHAALSAIATHRDAGNLEVVTVRDLIR